MINHPHMVLSIDEMERRSRAPSGVTAILCTAQADLELLAWSLVSLFLRSDPEVLHGAMVVINGMNGELQNRKQRMCMELRGILGPDKLRINRVYGHVGHAQAIDGAVPWLPTQHYLVMHDDVIVRNDAWTKFYQEKFLPDQGMAFARWGEKISFANFAHTKFHDRSKLQLPHLNSVFTLCRADILATFPAKWTGYHVPNHLYLSNSPEHSELLKFHEQFGWLNDRKKVTNRRYEFLNVDIGGWLLYYAQERGYGIARLPQDAIHHMVAMSWDQNEERRADRIAESRPDLEGLFGDERLSEKLSEFLGRWAPLPPVPEVEVNSEP